MSKCTRSSSLFEKPAILDVLGIIFLVIFIGFLPPMSGDPGIGWHLKTGEWILENWQIPYHDPFLWSTEGRKWISNQWLADIIFWLIFKTGGWDALGIFCFSLPLVTLILTQGRILLESKQSNFIESSDRISKTNYSRLLEKAKILGPFLFLALSVQVSWVQWIVRPVIISFVLFSVLFYWIWRVHQSRTSSKPKFLFSVLILFAFWANMHSAFPLGFLLLASVAFASLCEGNYSRFKLFIAAILLGSLSTFLNPYGYHLHANILALVGDSYFMTLNSEWLSPAFSNPLFLPLILALGLLIFSVGSGQTSSPLWLRIVTVVFAVLALKGVRFTPFLGLILPAIFVTTSSSENSTSEQAKHLVFFPIALIIFSIGLFIYALFGTVGSTRGYAPKLFEDDKMWQTTALACQRSGGKIYNHPDLGGAITFLLGPECKAGLDDRNELNGVDAYKRFFQLSLADKALNLDMFPKALLIECSSPLAVLARESLQGVSISADFQRFCLIERYKR